MTKGKSPADERVLDGEECNRMWLEMRSLRRVQAALYEKGIRSPRTGKAVSVPAIAMSAWRWSVKNPEKSFELEKKARAVEGVILTREMWMIELIQHAQQVLTGPGYLKWVQKYGLENEAKKFTIS